MNYLLFLKISKQLNMKTFASFIFLLAAMTLQAQTSIEISNSSFENGTTGWTTNMSRQSNTAFSRKQGTYYLEKWVDRGKSIGDAYVYTTLSGLSDGNYTLKAVALHIQQSTTGSTANKGTAQTGAYLYAADAKTKVTAMKQYTLQFSVVDGESTVELGLKAENGTGNWICADNFILTYDGEVTLTDYANVVQRQIDLANEYLTAGIQNSVAEPLRTAMEAAQSAVEAAKNAGENANTEELLSQLRTARAGMTTALDAAKASRTRYEKLQTAIDYAKKVYEWWKDEPRKKLSVGNLETAIETAEQKMTNYDLTDSELSTSVGSLNNRVKMVDKKIYTSTNACGTESQLKKATSQWCYDRSYQSKHWILFWEAGYGTAVPAAVPEIMDTADKIFEFYADSLKFITINQGKSKTDNYKMIIRLRYTTDWEASGSGIDNQIGLLTLSNGAHTSRSGQTVAHEIGHCFQYQTHCDNNNQNGWMYTWANSGNGNVFWEMCAQWQAYKFYPSYQFNNEWLNNTLNGLHKNPLAEELRYNNYFIQDYFCHKHGMDIIGRLWNESKKPEDPFQAYMRITMDEELTDSERLDLFNNEMWEYGARMATFDLDPIRTAGASTIGKRSQTTLTKLTDNYFQPTAAVCPENFGNNVIRLNVPATAKTVYAEFTGLPGEDGYISYNTTKAGWKVGFVALQKDGTRIYGDIATATYDQPATVVAFDCPSNCSYLWLVVIGAPTEYWSRGWNGTTVDDEQWPYKVKLFQTNVYGNANNNTFPTAIDNVKADTDTILSDNNVYSISGQVVRQGTTSLEGLPRGIYIVNGRKVAVRY